MAYDIVSGLVSSLENDQAFVKLWAKIDASQNVPGVFGECPDFSTC